MGVRSRSSGVVRWRVERFRIKYGAIFMFDESSSYLDVKQRMNCALTFRSLFHPHKFLIVIDYDLSGIYLCRTNCLIYDVISMPFSVREGINIYF